MLVQCTALAGIFAIGQDNNLDLRTIMLKRLSQSQAWVEILSSDSPQEIHVSPREKTFCYKDYLITACKNGKISRLDLNNTDNSIFIHAQQNGEFSCITTKEEILVTAQAHSKEICLWNISDLTPYGTIKTEISTLHVEIIDNLLIALNTAGDIDFYSWNSGLKLCTITTGIYEPIAMAAWNKTSKTLFITTTKVRYKISLGNMIMLDQLLHELSTKQLTLVAYLLQNRKNTIQKNPEIEEDYKTLPQMIRDILRITCSRA